MSEYGFLVIYCVLVLVASMFGGYLPFLGRVTHSRLQFYLSAAAGVMLGASFFHVMPEALEMSKRTTGYSFPSVHFILSFVLTVERVRNEKLAVESRKMTGR